MAQGFCWLLARLAGLSCVVVSRSRQAALLCEKPFPAWFRPWLPRLLRATGCLGPGERAVMLETSGAPVRIPLSLAEPPVSRTRFSLRGRLRREFVPGAFVRFRARSLREAADFAQLKANALERNS